MNNTATIDQIQYLFTFPFKAADWKRKFLIGFLLYMAGFIIPIIPWIFVSGYIARIIKMGVNGDDFTLPEWDDWGDLLTKGLQLMGVGLMAVLPFIILFGCGYLTMMSPAIMGSFTSPGYRYQDEAAGIFTLVFMFGTFGGMCIMGLGMLFSMLVGLLMPAAMGHVIAEDQFSAVFRVTEWWSIFKANIGGYLIAYVLLLGTTMLMTIAFQLLYFTIVLCCLIPFIASLISVYIGVVMGAIFGQVYRVGEGNRALVLLTDETIEENSSLD
jgi:hypothetical protein